MNSPGNWNCFLDICTGREFSRGLSQFDMMLPGAWFELIAATLFAILLLATRYRPPWWFWNGTSVKAGCTSEEKLNRRRKTVKDVPGPFSLPIIGTRWIFSNFGGYQMNEIHEAYKE
ncbi:uncharacterized protein LOC107262989 [Cephus cinctus]|uniref:Uncharacterized protein LOC107262989 n=1 Tax=Cephus cinctus TaxID=211228 RepID=A0AAJ7VWQ9_CEPCN|nr:uncharacterized protein LOC107262989 [Cephus cinctus]